MVTMIPDTEQPTIKEEIAKDSVTLSELPKQPIKKVFKPEEEQVSTKSKPVYQLPIDITSMQKKEEISEDETEIEVIEEKKAPISLLSSAQKPEHEELQITLKPKPKVSEGKSNINTYSMYRVQ